MADSQLAIDQAKATFAALTRAMRPRTLVDNIFQARPIWNKLRQNMKPVSGTSFQPAIELRQMTGRKYTRKTNLNLGAEWAPEIATTADYETYEYLMHVQIPMQDILKQGTQGLVDLHQAYIKNAIKSVRTDFSSDLFQTRGSDGTGAIGTGRAVDATTSVSGMNTLDQCMWYGNTYGGVNPLTTNQETWEAHVVQGQANASSEIEAVAPSLQNFEFAIEQVEMTCDEKPDLIVVTEDTWQALKAQVPAQDYAMQRAAYKGTDIVRWGYSALWVLDVPIVRDRDCYGEDFTPGQATTVLAKGHDAYGINFNHFWYIFNRNASFRWHEDGWERGRTSYDCLHNQYYVWGNTACDSRRAQLRFINIDPTMDISDFELATMRLPGADA